MSALQSLLDSQNSSEENKEESESSDESHLLKPGDIPEDPKPNKESSKSRPKRSKVDNRSRPGTGRAKDLTDDLTAMFGSFAMPLYAFSSANPRLGYDAHIVMTNAPKVAEELNKLAQRNPAVHRVLHAMMNGTDGMALLVALSGMIVPILANHEIIPKNTAVMLGAPNPDGFDPMEAMNNGDGTQTS